MRKFLVTIVLSNKYHLGWHTQTFTIEDSVVTVWAINEQIMNLRLKTGESVDILKVDEIESIAVEEIE